MFSASHMVSIFGSDLLLNLVYLFVELCVKMFDTRSFFVSR